jgi:hypothetical protein
MDIIKKILIFILCFLLGAIVHGWAALAIYYCSFPSVAGLRIPAAVVYLLAVILWIILNRKHTRAFFLSLLIFAAVVLWFNTIQPEPDTQYPQHLTLPYAEFNGDTLTVHNVRNCVYRTREDFDVRYETRTYRLSELRTMDILVNYWGMDLIAHTFLSFGFSDGQYLAVSVEIRPAVGESYNMLAGFFKQYELIYIWGDERDLVRLRTNYRKENAYLYRTTLSPDKVQRMFVSMMQATNAIHEKPQFYNTLTQSCTNTLGNHVIAAKIEKIPIWKRRFLTGDVDRRLYNNGLLVTYGLPFPELRQKANIDQRGQAADQDSDFSQKIRTHLSLN